VLLLFIATLPRVEVVDAVASTNMSMTTRFCP
jgi:hypothetical protein